MKKLVYDGYVYHLIDFVRKYGYEIMNVYTLKDNMLIFSIRKMYTDLWVRYSIEPGDIIELDAEIGFNITKGNQ